MVVVNMVNKENVHFDTVLDQLKERFSKRIHPLLVPINPGPSFSQVADVLRKKMITYKTDGSGKYGEQDLPDDWKDRIDKLHDDLIEYIAESNDTLLEKFFDEGSLSEEDLRAGMQDAIRNGMVIPLVCTAADINVGVNRFMDLLAKYGSSPADI
ncbi:MAG: hypothetical protein ISR95_08135 [Candidatus Marinimicrobia bacterium]|nr:hypothetical protein [Candidatus Neomarinimicrobiota bacterium]